LTVIAYLWIPDTSRYANRQIPEASLLEPGQTICYNKIAISKSNQNTLNLLLNEDESIKKFIVQNEQA